MKFVLFTLCGMVALAANAKAELQWYDYKFTPFSEQRYGYQLRKSFGPDHAFACWHLTIPIRAAGVYRGARLFVYRKPREWPPQESNQIDVSHHADGTIEITFSLYPSTNNAELVLNTGMVLDEGECQPAGGVGGFKFPILSNPDLP